MMNLKKSINVVKPVSGMPAAVITKINATIISDIHIGYEEELAKSGIFLPRSQLVSLLGKVDELHGALKTKRMIVNGDLKHSFARPSKRVSKEISTFLSALLSYYEDVVIVKGNHDNYIAGIAKKHNIDVVDYFSEENILIIHGHKDPGKEYLGQNEFIVIGHEHPSIGIRDEIGHLNKFIVILYVPTVMNNIIVVLPPFSLLSTGTLISTKSRNSLLSPILKNYGILEDAVPFIIEKELGLIELPKLQLLESMIL
ncbi:MAG: metallophosphoesterase [Thermoprotei archaeon]|jgi:putative SbcD/Mre11-related phosphoesterase